jgi:sugar transferase (PEP-CTERM/EpsH1 system associated)
MMNTSPTVCHLLHSLHVGGAEVLAARLARRLGDRFRFVFACLDDLGPLGEQLRAEGFAVEVLGRRPGVDWRCSVRLGRLLRRQRVAVLHAHQYTPFFYGLTARLVCRRPALLFTEHGRHHPDYPRRKRIWLNRLLLQRRDRVVAVGAAVRQALIANEGLPAERVAVITNGIDLAPYAGPAPDRDAVRRELGAGPDDWLIVQVARLDYLKDHATALRALAHAVGRLPNARLVLVGDGPERPAIERLRAEAGLADRVWLLGPRGDVPRLLRAADLFLLTSISEGIPLTVIEAMAAGLPVVATRVGGVPEVVDDGVTGLLAAAGDAGALAAHLVALAGQPDQAREMGRRGRDRAWAVFSEERMVDAYARLYREMAGG